MATDDPERGRVFGFEINHEFPSEIATELTEEAMNARTLLSAVGFNLESAGNKIALLIDPTTRDSIKNAPPSVSKALTEAGSRARPAHRPGPTDARFGVPYSHGTRAWHAGHSAWDRGGGGSHFTRGA